MLVDAERLRAELFPAVREPPPPPRPADIAPAGPQRTEKSDRAVSEDFNAAAIGIRERLPAPPPNAPAAVAPLPVVRDTLGDSAEQMRTLLSLHAVFAGRTDAIARNAASAIRDEVHNRLVLKEHLNSLIE
jgi:hypothetical protein